MNIRKRCGHIGWAILAIALGASSALAAEIPRQVPVDISIVAQGGGRYTFQNTYARPFYFYDLDQPNTSNCNSACAEIWIPVYPTANNPTDVGDFTLVRRGDGTQQWAYKGKPLYTFGFGEHEPPTPKDIEGKWHTLVP